MKRFMDGKIAGYDNHEILRKIHDMPLLDDLSITLPDKMDEDIEKEIISFLHQITPKGQKRFGGHVEINNGKIKIIGWIYTEKLLKWITDKIETLAETDHNKYQMDIKNIKNDIIYELLQIGMPFSAPVVIRSDLQTYLESQNDSKIKDAIPQNFGTYIIGPQIEHDERFDELWEPCFNIIIEYTDGIICGFLPRGVLDFLYEKDPVFFIDDAVIYKLKLRNDEILNVRLFLLTQDEFRINYLKPGKNVEDLQPKWMYH